MLVHRVLVAMDVVARRRHRPLPLRRAGHRHPRVPHAGAAAHRLAAELVAAGAGPRPGAADHGHPSVRLARGARPALGAPCSSPTRRAGSAWCTPSSPRPTSAGSASRRSTASSTSCGPRRRPRSRPCSSRSGGPRGRVAAVQGPGRRRRGRGALGGGGHRAAAGFTCNGTARTRSLACAARRAEEHGRCERLRTAGYWAGRGSRGEGRDDEQRSSVTSDEPIPPAPPADPRTGRRGPRARSSPRAPQPGDDGCRGAELAALAACSRPWCRGGSPVVVELGPGTGAVTAVISARLPPTPGTSPWSWTRRWSTSCGAPRAGGRRR